jgi:hypothetical protein
MKNTMTDLRNHLFEVMEALKDEEKPIDIDRAKAVCLVSQQLVDTAKVEVAFLEATGARNTSKFMQEQPKQLENGRMA